MDSIEETLTLAEESGGTVVAPKTPITDSSWWAVIADPDGNHIGLVEGSVDV